MSEFEIDYQKERKVCVNISCLKCQEDFFTELDIDYSIENFPSFSDGTLYCVDCEVPYDYTIKIDFNKIGIAFKDRNIFGKLEYSESVDIELEPESEEFNPEKTIADSKHFYNLQIERLKKLLDVNSKEYIVQQSLNRLIFSGVITSLETYLNEVLIAVVFSSSNTLEKFVSQYEPYKKELFSLNEIFSKHNGLNKRVRDDLNNLIYHNISKLIRIFNIFDFELNKFPEINSIAKNIGRRHNFVHRSGLDEKNNFQAVTEDEIISLINETNLLVEYIDNKIRENIFHQKTEIFFLDDDLPF